MKKLIIPAVFAAMLLSAGCGSSPQTITESDTLVISTDKVTETASFYPIKVDGVDMEILAIKDSSGNIRTAFNTCQSCYTSGNGRYKAEGKELVCQNCGFRFTADQVGIEKGGGCNPWPIYGTGRTVSDDKIEISYDFLKNSKDIFANW